MTQTTLVRTAQTWRVLRLSAGSPEELEQARLRAAEDPEAEHDSGGPYRMAVVAKDSEQTRDLLLSPDQVLVARAEVFPEPRSLVLLFPGVGDQQAGMAKGAYDSLPVFRQAFDTCAQLLLEHLGADLRKLLYPEKGAAPADLKRTRIAQPLVFATEYSLATLLRSWGLTPTAMLGYSVGEYAAACAAGVLALPDALRLVARRAELIEQVEPGAMLLVQLGFQEVAGHLRDGVGLAAANGPETSVVSGPVDSIAKLEKSLLAQSIPAMRVPTEHAFHSAMMSPIVQPLIEQLRRAPLNAPTTPFLSNVTGGWIADDEATDPAYWARHLTQPVRFVDNVAAMWQLPSVLAVESGPGQMLSSLANLHPARPGGERAKVVPALSRLASPHGELPALLMVAAQAWVHGFTVDWEAVASRVPLRSWSRIR